LPRNLVSIGVGEAHTCVVVDGGVQCWGFNGSGQLGDGTTVSSLTPIQTIPANSGATQVSSGLTYSCAVVAGGVKCWGDYLRVGGSSLLGNGATTGSTLPVQTIAAGSGATQVAAGYEHACAVINGGAMGTAKCWGSNGNGQLGRGNTNGSLVPVDVSSISGVTAITAGRDFTCAVASGATLGATSARCWGKNDAGQLGIGSNGGTNTTPAQVSGLTSNVTAIAAGESHACVVRSGGVFCWGASGLGQLGDNQGRPGFTNSPVQAIAASSSVSSVSAGGNSSCAASNTGPPFIGIRCWGDNYAGGIDFRPRFIFTDAVTTPIVGTGAGHTCATRNGALQCFGLSGAGQLGIGEVTVLTPTFTNRFSNSAIEAISISQISAGANHTCAVVNGAARCIGGNESNQQFISTAVTTPQVAAGKGFSCAIVDGGVKCIGASDQGQVGNTSSTPFTIPFQTVAANSGATAVSTNEINGCAVVAGGVKCWGANAFGQLGNGTTTSAATCVRGGQWRHSLLG
jgi:alpha-tubulin suppressor-like RCC1 family protein